MRKSAILAALGALLISACGGVTPADPDAALPCGNAVVDEGEDCDLGAANGAAGSCCTAACLYAADTVVCRVGSGDACDPAEACTGASADCPDDVVASAGESCRPDADGPGCDAEETCTGVAGEACPADVGRPDGSPCEGNGEGDCSGPDTCQAGVCSDNDYVEGTACGAGVDEPTCNPDACDGVGACVDNPEPQDGAVCADNGGDTCCGGGCTTGQPGPGLCDPCALGDPGVLQVTIIESLSEAASRDMETRWSGIVSALGHSYTIEPQAFLDNINNLANTDVLIVSSGTLDLPANRRATVSAFAQSGRGVYIQGEYQITYTSNIAFQELVNNDGGSFNWTGTVTGQLDPVAVTGCFATDPEVVGPLTYYWYGATGTGADVEAFQDKDGQGVGFAYCASSGAMVVVTTDQDYVRIANADANNEAMLRNILARISVPCN